MSQPLTLESMRSEVLAMGRTALQTNPRWGYALTVLTALTPLSLFINARAGAYIAVLNLALLLALAAYDHLKRRLALAVALIPLIGMVDLSVIQASSFEQTAIFYSAMLILAVVYRASWPRHILPTHHAHIPSKLLYPAGIVLGGLLGLLSAKLLAGGYIFGGVDLRKILLLAIVGALAEENLFRGLIQREASQLLSPWLAAGLTAVLYLPLALSHFTLWSLLTGAISAGLVSAAYVFKPSLVLTTGVNLASKLIYVIVTATVIF